MNIKRIRKLGESEQFFCAIILHWRMFISFSECHVCYLGPGFWLTSVILSVILNANILLFQFPHFFSQFPSLPALQGFLLWRLSIKICLSFVSFLHKGQVKTAGVGPPPWWLNIAAELGLFFRSPSLLNLLESTVNRSLMESGNNDKKKIYITQCQV